MKSNTPLQRGDKIKLFGEQIERDITGAGVAGFFVRGSASMLKWFERGTIWTSEMLDRRDENQTRFREAATGGEGTT
jgi:hypothetical protein